MTLKGGMLMAAASARRMTKDADLSTVGMAHEQALVAEVSEIAATTLDVDDGLIHDVASLGTEVMREHAEYHGVRVKLLAHLATARMTTTRDFSFGDPHRSVTLEPDIDGAAISGHRISRWRREHAGGDRQGDRVVADCPPEVLPHFASGCAPDRQGGRDVERVGAHQHDVLLFG